MSEMIEMMKMTDYGALEIDYRQNEGNKYYVYGYKNDVDYWEFETGDLLTVTGDLEFIKMLHKNFNVIDNEFRYCRHCFKIKKVVSSAYCCFVYDWLNNRKEILIQIQNNLLNTQMFSWRNVATLTSHFSVSHLCCKSCGDNGKLWDHARDEISIIDKAVKEEVSRYIINKRDEKILELYLKENIHLIEEGMTFIDNQKPVLGGNKNEAIDILAKDINGRICIIELKTVTDDRKLIHQAAYYPYQFGEDVRMITIAPGYSSYIFKALKNVNNTELKIYKLNNEGILQVEDYPTNEVNSASPNLESVVS